MDWRAAIERRAGVDSGHGVQFPVITAFLRMHESLAGGTIHKERVSYPLLLVIIRMFAEVTVPSSAV